MPTTNAAAPVSDRSTPLEGFAAALDWWRGAGVDCDFTDEPTSWLDEREAEAEPERAEPKRASSEERRALKRALAPSEGAAIGGDRANWPQDLAAFREFWLREPSLDEAALRDRVPPRGEAGAKLMVLVPQPDEGDREVLLAGPQGKMLDAVRRAMGLAERETYFASALPRRAALPEWDDLARRGLGEVTRHHIALAAPKRVLVFGRALAPLLGGAEARDVSGVPLLFAPALDGLARSAMRRQRFWNDWLEWTD